MANNLADEFKKYAGREVTIDVAEQYVAAGDETIADIKNDAQRFDLSLRIWFPNSAGTMEMNPKRLNIYIAEEAGKYVVQDRFDLG